MGTFFRNLSDTLFATKAAGATLRSGVSTANVLQAADVNGIHTALADLRNRSPVTPEDYGAVGDGVTNDAAAVQAALDAAVSQQRVLSFQKFKTYLVNTEILHSTVYELHVEGNGAAIVAGAAIRSPFAVTSGGNVLVSRLEFRGGRLSTYACYLSNASSSEFEHCLFYQGLKDGCHCNDTTDRLYFNRCRFERNGKVFSTSGYAGPLSGTYLTTVAGTVQITQPVSTNIIVGTGTSFLSCGARRGDWLSVDAASPGGYASTYKLQIESVDSDTQITCTQHPTFAATAAGLKYSIHVGDGLHEGGGGRGDRNINEIHGCSTLGNAGSGYMMNGLYGSEVNTLICNSNGAFPLTIGICAADVVYGAVIKRFYVEGNGLRDNAALMCCFDVERGVWAVGARDANDRSPYISNTSFVSDFSWGQLNQIDHSRIESVNPDTTLYVPAKRIAAGARMASNLVGRSYTSADDDGGSALYLNESPAVNKPWRAVSGVEPPAGGADPNALAFDFDTVTAVAVGSAKYLHSWKVAGTRVMGIGFGGDLKGVPSTDSSGTPGAATINKPSGRSALAAGASSVVITNSLVTAATKVFFTPAGNDATATRLYVTPGSGSFTLTANANATGALVFDWFIVN